MAFYPIVKEIPYHDPGLLFSLFKEESNVIFLDSAEERLGSGRYSFIATDPFLTLKVKNHLLYQNDALLTANPFDVLQQELKKYFLQAHPDLPPFQGGAAGYFGYELFKHLEKIPQAKSDDMAFPDMMIGFFDVVMAFDVSIKKAWVFSSGFPMQGDERLSHAHKRLQAFLNKLKIENILSNQKTIRHQQPIYSNFSREGYMHTAEVMIDYILKGDIFEANLSQRFKTDLPNDFSAYDLYYQLRALNPAPFAAYLQFERVRLLSASPERFIQLKSEHVEARPIKGTRARGQTPLEDKELRKALLTSEKDHAENVMIVDLLRNDLSRVCEATSVKVPQLCGLESYATVHHLVSVITGKLKPKKTAIDLLKATFPGGSITGAPKIRAMEIISELEPTERGPYCGSIGYINFNGDMDLSICIRTYCIKDHTLTFQVGGAIVADSNPSDEYQETLTKARALFHALTGHPFYDFTH